MLMFNVSFRTLPNTANFDKCLPMRASPAAAGGVLSSRDTDVPERGDVWDHGTMPFMQREGSAGVQEERAAQVPEDPWAHMSNKYWPPAFTHKAKSQIQKALKTKMCS